MTSPGASAAKAPGAANAPWRWLPWLIGGCYALILTGFDYLMLEDGIISNSVLWGRDFINVWTGGRLVDAGRLDLIYDRAGYEAFQAALFGHINPHNYSYPPVTFPLAALFSSLPYEVALIGWLVGTGALFVHAVRAWWPANAGPHWLAVLTPAGLLNIWAGHYGFLLGALFLLGWQRLDRHPAQAGIFFGLMLIKPHLAVFVPFVLLARGEWRALAAGAATVAALVVASGLWFGWAAWHQFLFGVSALQAAMIDAESILFVRISTSMMTSLLFNDGAWPLAVAGQMLSIAIGTTIVALAVRRGVETRALAFIVATATFLVLPYAFSYDLTVVMVGALAVLARSDLGRGEYRLAIYGFICPQLGMVLTMYGFPLMPVMLAGLAWVQLRVASRDAAPDCAKRSIFPRAASDADRSKPVPLS